MKAHLVKFLLCSLAMHLAVLWLLWQAGHFAHGMVRSATHSSKVLTVRLVTSTREPAREAAGKLLQNRASAAVLPSFPIFDADEGLPKPSKPITGQDYLPPGKLTRLPAPLTDIDLNVAEISGLGIAGKIRLMLLIDIDGSVADVLVPEEADIDHAFAQRVAARFKEARFLPGEVLGQAVKSQLNITVVSEHAGAPDER